MMFEQLGFIQVFDDTFDVIRRRQCVAVLRSRWLFGHLFLLNLNRRPLLFDLPTWK